MTIYADTSFWLAFWAGPEDSLNPAARRTARRFLRDDWLWTELHAVEVPCAARAATHVQPTPMPAAVARAVVWRAERAANTRQVQRRSLPLEASVNQVLVLGEAHGWETRHMAFDTWHVAAAWALGVDVFVTFDKRQAALATAAGLMVAGVR